MRKFMNSQVGNRSLNKQGSRSTPSYGRIFEVHARQNLRMSCRRILSAPLWETVRELPRSIICRLPTSTTIWRAARFKFRRMLGVQDSPWNIMERMQTLNLPKK